MNTSLELSKKLYEKGLELNTEKWWCDFGKEWKLLIEKFKPHPAMDRSCSIPAFSTDELLAIMPEIRISKKKDAIYIEDRDNDKWYLRLAERITLSEALGKMCLWLLENNWSYDDRKKILMKGKKCLK
jgi:hypothetical protein